jgi:hypothetical protein
VQSSFADPCHPQAGGGFFSGFVFTPDGPSKTTFTITVKDTKPIWFYCAQTAMMHCQAGMVGAVNAPSTGNTLAAFTNLAKNATLSTVPSGGVQGGTLNTNGASSNSSSSGSSSGSGSGSSSTYTTSYTTSYSTTATVNTQITSAYTSAGQVYTTTYASSYTTAYATTVATAAVTTAAVSSSGAIQASAASAVGVSGVMSSMFVLGAALIGALAMA